MPMTKAAIDNHHRLNGRWRPHRRLILARGPRSAMVDFLSVIEFAWRCIHVRQTIAQIGSLSGTDSASPTDLTAFSFDLECPGRSIGYGRSFRQTLLPGFTRAIHQQVQHIISGAIRDGHLQVLLTSRDRAEIGNRPSQTRQLQQAFDQPHALAQWESKQAFQRQAKLDGGIAIDR